MPMAGSGTCLFQPIQCEYWFSACIQSPFCADTPSTQIALTNEIWWLMPANKLGTPSGRWSSPPNLAGLGTPECLFATGIRIERLRRAHLTHTIKMPRLELESPDLLALRAVQKKIGPLIAKRILDDTETITNLPVLSSWKTFKFEIDQMFLCLTQGQDLPQDDFDAFLRGLHQIFQLFEDLIDDKVLGPAEHFPAAMEKGGQSSISVTSPGTEDDEQSPNHVPASYPKLKALVSLASRASTSMGFSTFLCLSETVEKSRKAEEMITNFNISNDTRSNTATRLGAGDINYASARHKTSNKTTSKSEHESIEKSQQCISKLLNALKEHIGASACSSNHIAKIQIRYPDGSTESTNGVQHRFFVSCCLLDDHCQEQTTSTLSLWNQAREGATHQIEWQETTCTVVSQLQVTNLSH